jgi:hypothetical protein
MKSNSKSGFVRLPQLLAVAFALLGGLVLFMGSGCQTSAPGFGVYPSPATVLNTNRVDQFNMGTSVINPNLFENNNPPSYGLRTPGSVTLVNNFGTYGALSPEGTDPGLGLEASGGPAGDPAGAACFRMSGAVTDLLDGKFPALDMEVPMENYSATYYDANHFTGVKFYLKVANDDTAFHRVFAIPVAQTVPIGTNNGSCPAGPKQCYDHFAADYSGGTGGQWVLSSYNFSDLQQLQSGYAPTPSTMTGGNGANLKQVEWLQWEEGNNNKRPGQAIVDVYVDDIEFF